MEHHQLSYKSSTISYLQFGTGQKTAICFHGYGEEASSFDFLEKYAADQFTFFAIDLPFHGKTDWKEGYNFSTSDICQIIDMILKKSGKEHVIINRQLSLIGFSLGGRVALSIYERIASATGRLILLAPDGLKINFWYWLSTQTWIGSKLFAFTMKNPHWFFVFLKMLNRLGLVNASIFKFVNYYIGDADVRRLLYARWMCLRKLKPNLHAIKSLIKGNKTQARLLYGKHDKIILPVRGEKFIKGLEAYASISVINSGHQVLNEKYVHEILAALLH